MAKGSDRVRINVGGKIFETKTTTLAKAGRSSMLGALLDEDWNLKAGDGAAAEYFIDRNPECFSVLLDFLRSGELDLPPHIPDELFYREALFYGLLDDVRAARWGPFDGDRLRHAFSISSPAAPSHATAIRASPDGGCCVAHGNVIRVYDWVLDEPRPINLDLQPVNDAGYVDSGHIVVTVRESLDRAHGGMGLFASSSGELRHRFRVFHDNEAKDFTASALCFSDSQSKIFASCRGRHNINECGVGVWDQNTGDQSDFFYEPTFGNADKLQWIEGDSLLMVAALSQTRRTDNCFIGIVDFREKKNLVWSWTDEGTYVDSSVDDTGVFYAIVMEDNKSICVVNQYEDLGFLDLRNNRGGIRWRSKRSLFNGMFAGGEKTLYPKLAMKGGKLFSSTNDGISVFSRPDWVRTSRLRSGVGSSIWDFSIGGGRLFALHDEENVFDIWESPTLPIL